jgi:CheY-like chemotaxis protein
MQTVELNELISHIERMLRPVLGERTQLVTKLSREPLCVLIDAGQLEQVIVELVINARDATSEAGRIELTTGRQSVQARDAEGLALGDHAWLEVAQHQGATRDGQRTLMRVLLPLASAVRAVAGPSGVVPGVLTHRVLVVEDEPQVRVIAARALTQAGFEVVQAGNGASGLALLKEQRVPFDVIVTDVVMPELSGPDLARAARAFDESLGIVFMSGFPEPMHNAHASDFAGAAFLAKPFGPRALVQAVRDCIERRGVIVREQG